MFARGTPFVKYRDAIGIGYLTYRGDRLRQKLDRFADEAWVGAVRPDNLVRPVDPDIVLDVLEELYHGSPIVLKGSLKTVWWFFSW